MSAHDDIVARAKQRAEASPLPESWGYRVALEPGQSFIGRWRGETEDPDNVDSQGKPRRIFLFWDEAGERCFSRTYAALAREIDRVRPTAGCTIAVVRGEDYVTAQGTGYSYGVETEECDDPLPADPVGEAADDDIPF